MICLPYLVIKRMTRHTPLLQEKAQFCAVRDKRDPFFCSNGAENWLVSRLRKGREKMRHFLVSALLSKI